MRWLVAFASLLLLVAVTGSGHAQQPKGAAVVAANEAARPAAKELARFVYRDAKLRPGFDETIARALLGEAPSEEGPAKEIAGVVGSLDTSDEAVARRVLASTGKELGVSLVVLVESDDKGPRARVLRVSEQRFLGVTLTPKQLEGGALDWQDGVGLLRSLPEAQPLPGPRRANLPKPKTKPKTKKNGAKKNGHKPDTGEKSDETPNLLTSPWFWGGLGVVVSVGVTVLVLSQTVFKDSEAVTLEGRVSP